MLIFFNQSCKSVHGPKPIVTEADVYAQVASLFQDNPELLLEFRQFLPDANGGGGGASFINGVSIVRGLTVISGYRIMNER